MGHITGHFGGESLQAINCTGTDNQKQENKTLHNPQKTNSLPQLTEQTKHWYGTTFTTSDQQAENE